jgi:hypothetical protein
VWLPSIPGIFMSRIKEPNFFSRRVIGNHHPMVKPIRDEGEYLNLFSAANGSRFVGEATPFYLQDPEAPTEIKRKSPDARVIVSLRDPVERLYSHYLMMRNNMANMGSFSEEIERGLLQSDNRNLAVLDPSIGLYSRQIERYRREFGNQSFKVLVLEEWSRDAVRTLRSISAFLGLQSVLNGFDAPPQRRYGEARGSVVRFVFGNRQLSRASEALIPLRVRKFIRNALLVKEVPKPPMDPRARKFLIDYYQNDVRRTQGLLGRRLPWPNFENFEVQESTLLAG